MEKHIQNVFDEMSRFNELMEQIDSNDSAKIILFCERVVSYLTRCGLASRHYEAYKADWERFNKTLDVSDRNLHELFVYLFTYSRAEHMSGDYGEVYVDAFKRGAIPALIREIVRRTEQMTLVQKDTSDKTGRIGIAGEFFVAAELSRHGYVASLTSKNTKTIDILASDKNGNRQVAIQVKTCDDNKRLKWKMSDSAEQVSASNVFYVFVNMNEGKEPTYYVVPSKYVAHRIREDYLNWLNTPGKNGHKRNETTMRTFSFLDDIEGMQYQNAWYLLGL